MGLTGVIYAIIVIGWAAFLVPLALRRHDQAARNRSIERFSSAMRVLSRRSSAESRVVVTPPRSTDRLVTPTLAAGRGPDGVEPVRMPRPTRAAMRAAAARRRRVLLVLIALTAVVGGVAAFGYLPWWSVLVPAAVVVAFLMLARRQVRMADRAFWDEAATVGPGSSNVRPAAARVDASHGAARTAADQAADEDGLDDEPTVTLTAEQVARAAAVALEEEIVEVVAMTTADGNSLWDPLPVTLPTYVDKPVATRTYRTIDLNEPGTWSAGHTHTDTAMADGGDDTEVDPAQVEQEQARAANA